jgi:dienelactone hydrolase
MSSRRLLALVLAIAALLGTAFLFRPYLKGAAFVVRAAEMQGAIRSAADISAREVTERSIQIEATTGAGTKARMAGRLYVPSGRSRRMVLLVSGLHPAGIEEPRLMNLARQLAASGLTVATPDILELSRFEIAPTVTDEIEAAALWLSDLANSSEESVDDGRIGMMGISFSGGLSVVAGGRPSLRDRVAFVFSLGGHDDLPRVLKYLCTGIEPLPSGQIRLETGPVAPDREISGRSAPQMVRPPHDYGVAIILLGVAERLVPAVQLEALRGAVRRFLLASALERVDKQRSDDEFAALRKLAGTLPQPAATLLRYVNDRDVIHLGAKVLPYVELYGGAASLSPSRSPKPSAPVFLLHGLDDNLIPAAESEYLANGLRGRVPMRLLLTGLISHAAVERTPSATQVMELAGFWGDLLTR